MATNNKKTGYSDALGGYGVPSQVKITGEADLPGGSAKGAKPRKGKGVVFRPKPRNIIIIVVIAVAVLVGILAATGVLGGSSRYASSIDHVGSEIQPVNGADATVYRPVVAEKVDWNNVDAKERNGIARYAVKSTIEDIGGENAGIFQIFGETYDGQHAFLYSPTQGTIQIYVNGAVEEVISLE
ncbi:MAG: hypothetical protein LBL54_05110 [Clostridiales Family XIII bacterium]|jgi:hypothetical protein|nr:hypothetical protein [Clostridiales Family XIII bacterium]